MAHDGSKSAEKTKTHQATWPDFVAAIFDRLEGGASTFAVSFEDFDLYIPSKLGEDSDHFRWKMNGRIRFSSEESDSKDD